MSLLQAALSEQTTAITSVSCAHQRRRPAVPDLHPRPSPHSSRFTFLLTLDPPRPPEEAANVSGPRRGRVIRLEMRITAEITGRLGCFKAEIHSDRLCIDLSCKVDALES